MYAAIYCLTLNEENISRNQNKPIKNSEMLDKYILFICSCHMCLLFLSTGTRRRADKKRR